MSRSNQAKRKAKKQKRVTKLRREGERRRRKLPVIDLGKRQCGGCTACCTVMEIPELDKPMWVKCENECEGGCAVYDDRPESCKEWFCFWRADGNGLVIKEHERPDKIGIFVELCQTEGSEPLAAVRESWPGGADSPEARDLIRRIAQRGLTGVFHYGADMPHLIGPAKEMREFKKNGRFQLVTPSGEIKVLWESGKENQSAT